MCSSPNPKEQSVCLAYTAPKKYGSDSGNGSLAITVHLLLMPEQALLVLGEDSRLMEALAVPQL